MYFVSVIHQSLSVKLKIKASNLKQWKKSNRFKCQYGQQIEDMNYFNYCMKFVGILNQLKKTLERSHNPVSDLLVLNIRLMDTIEILKNDREII